ncbi:MAG: right-handed parallel beta-helix repeat-containing protein [Ruminococcaceae bacterium]|nr:right-handed parallel beta-helix repeat-containing protein [Oscillospiraceae bacterium]
MAVYHVSKTGSDKNEGSASFPFLTISRAAKIAKECDTVIVHEGVYRECVSPEYGARNELGRITYTAAEGEKAVIKGSEEVCGWVREGTVWHTSVENSVFGSLNPYAEEIDGDWMQKPLDHKRHTGTVYLDGEALIEASVLEDLVENKMQWFAKVLDDTTEIYANFGEIDPNGRLTEINVRRSCFYPEKTGLDYITVRGFEMAHAATPWAPPTADQPGLIGTHWSKGWIIEDNIIHDARCSAVSVGKEISTGHNLYNTYHRKAGYVYQLETVFLAKQAGWTKEKIGSHIIRNNVIYNCGQNGIVGHMGGAFSEIYGNEIYNVGTKHEFFGYEIAGIKLHAALDTQIHHNNIHDCTMGTWLDWQAQGVHLYANIYHHNTKDLWLEVTHGPHLIDNNIFGSTMNLLNAAQGGAYVHNIFLGAIYKYDVLQRSTPYHFPHTTDIKGCSLTYGADDRFYNNIFANTFGEETELWKLGTAMYDGCPDSLEEYLDTVWKKHGKGDVEYYAREKQPVYTSGNFYVDGVPAYERENNSIIAYLDSNAKISVEADGLYLEMYIDESFAEVPTEIITTEKLGMPRITEALFENPDGTPITLDTDMLGNKRGSTPTVGALEGLYAGNVRIKIK